MRTLHLISHTHWDREWYLTFQQFRLKLVHLVDNLLDILAHDPDYKYFMLDGQTIVLEDYLQMRPEREGDIRKYVQNGRLLIGPWFILPDEFLVSPEASIRNLLEGDRVTKRFGAKMMVGYIPDPFGHIGQLPQIFRGFGIESACLWRGLTDEPCEFWWQSPDGSRVFMAYLRESYSNAALLPASDQQRFTDEVRNLRDKLAAHTKSDHLLLMYGTDHMEPPPDTAKAVAGTRGKLDGDRLIHSTLSVYINATQKSLGDSLRALPTIIGELRHSKRSHLLPGVLSARMWIKQRNRACETLLERWAEPFSTYANIIRDGHNQSSTSPILIQQPSAILRQAWRLLMENHPHDSICGCSIDQVHEEMRPRFDQVDQIGEEITHQSLEVLAENINTLTNSTNAMYAIVVFNPTSGPRADICVARAEFPGQFEIIDEYGNIVPHQVLGSSTRELVNVVMGKSELKSGLSMIHEGRVLGQVIHSAAIQRDGNQANIEVVLADTGQLDLTAWNRGLKEIEALIADPDIKDYHVHAHSLPAAEITFCARDIPGHGYHTYWLRPTSGSPSLPIKVGGLSRFLLPLVTRLARLPMLERLLIRSKVDKPPFIIENEFFHIEASSVDGSLTVKDKHSGVVFQGLNRFVDGGDCGDEYNYSPPASDWMTSARFSGARQHQGSVQQTLEIKLILQTPIELAPDRASRSQKKVEIPIVSRVTLTNGVARVDIQTEVNNLARDHRLRVHFPTPFSVPQADYDAHFEVLRRSIGVPDYDDTWIEQPRPEKPQRAFTDVSDGAAGLLIANRGLPEVEVKRQSNGKDEIVLTLLRCVNWISRDDFPTRRGHAGPMSNTPGAQMLGKWTFEYSLVPHTGDWLNADQHAYAFDSQLRATITDVHAGLLPSSGSFIHVEPSEFVISAVKEAEDKRGWLVRGYNLTDDPLKVTIRPWRRFKNAELINLAETRQKKIKPAKDGSIQLMARGHEIVSILFYY